MRMRAAYQCHWTAERRSQDWPRRSDLTNGFEYGDACSGESGAAWCARPERFAESRQCHGSECIELNNTSLPTQYESLLLERVFLREWDPHGNDFFRIIMHVFLRSACRARRSAAGRP